MKTIIKVVMVVLLLVALLGGFDVATQGNTATAKGTTHATIGVVQPVSAELCRDGLPGCVKL